MLKIRWVNLCVLNLILWKAEFHGGFVFWYVFFSSCFMTNGENCLVRIWRLTIDPLSKLGKIELRRVIAEKKTKVDFDRLIGALQLLNLVFPLQPKDISPKSIGNFLPLLLSQTFSFLFSFPLLYYDISVAKSFFFLLIIIDDHGHGEWVDFNFCEV